MLFKLSSYFILFCFGVIFFNNNSYANNSSDIIINEMYIEKSSEVMPTNILKKIDLESPIKGEFLFHLNHCVVHDLKISVIEHNDTTISYHYGLNVSHLPQLSSNGMSIPLKFEANEKKSILLFIDDRGWTINDSFSIKTKTELEKVFSFKKSIQTISKSITGILLFLGIALGIYLKKKVFLFYFLTSISAFVFFETESGIIQGITSSDYPVKKTQVMAGFIYHNILYFFYYMLIFNSKGLNRSLHKVMKLFVFLGITAIGVLHFSPNTIPLLNKSIIIIISTNAVFSYFIITYLLIKGIQFNRFIAKSTAIIFSITLLSTIIFAILPNMGLIDKLEISSYIFYVIFTFDIAYYLFIILYKYYKLIQERKELLLKYNDLYQGYSLALLEGQESEKNRIGRELHDYIGGNLALVDKMGSFFSRKSRNIIDETIQSLDDITKGLHPNSSKPQAFHQLLQELFNKYDENDFKLHITFHDNLNSSPYIQNQFYRITQELLSNASTHSKAKNVYIDYYHNPDNFSSNLFYMDDGKGIEKEINNDGKGLKNMKFRIEKLGGQMVIEHPPKGTKISFIGAKNIVNHQ